MKTNILKAISVFLLSTLFIACGKDNYDEPTSLLSGEIVYNGEALQLRGTDEKVRLQLYQDGFPNRSPIEVFVRQDGSFSAMLFNGEYKMVTRDNNGPWVNSRDTTLVTVSGSTVQNIEVTPYFTISNADMKLSDRTVTTTFTVNQIVQNREIDRILLLLNKTQFVDDDIRIQRIDYTGDDVGTGIITYTFDVNDDANKTAILYGRVCVWTKGADQGIYSPVIRLK